MSRLVIIGRNSTIWQTSKTDPAMAEAEAIGHADIASFDFLPEDRVWILSYSRRPQENTTLFQNIADRHAGPCFYVSSATANVTSVTSCYGYPTAKYHAEGQAREILDAAIIRIGLVYARLQDLPAGTNAATSYADLSTAMRAEPDKAKDPKLLLKLVNRSFGSAFEQVAYSVYAKVISALGSRPCLLRPVDVVLRLAGWRWYGYLFISNQLLMAERETNPAINGPDDA